MEYVVHIFLLTTISTYFHENVSLFLNTQSHLDTIFLISQHLVPTKIFNNFSPVKVNTFDINKISSMTMCTAGPTMLCEQIYLLR